MEENGFDCSMFEAPLLLLGRLPAQSPAKAGRPSVAKVILVTDLVRGCVDTPPSNQLLSRIFHTLGGPIDEKRRYERLNGDGGGNASWN